jgi:hypothetical protein
MIAQMVNRIAYAASLHFDVLTPPRKANPFRFRSKQRRLAPASEDFAGAL